MVKKKKKSKILSFYPKNVRLKVVQPTHPSPPRRFPGDILAEDFAQHVWRNERDSNYGFAEEYQVG